MLAKIFGLKVVRTFFFYRTAVSYILIVKTCKNVLRIVKKPTKFEEKCFGEASEICPDKLSEFRRSLVCKFAKIGR